MQATHTFLNALAMATGIQPQGSGTHEAVPWGFVLFCAVVLSWRHWHRAGR